MAWRPGLGYEKADGRLFMLSGGKGLSYLSCVLREYPIVHICLALIPIFLVRIYRFFLLLFDFQILTNEYFCY